MNKRIWISTVVLMGCSSSSPNMDGSATARINPSVEVQDYPVHPSSVRHGFRGQSGAWWDCVEREQTPAAQRFGLRRIPDPPNVPPPPGQVGLPPIGLTGDADGQGHVRSCPEGTVPIRRAEPGDSPGFGKSPGEADPICTLCGQAGPDDNSHQHAVIRNTSVSVRGSGANLNIWKPYIEYPSAEFSLHQIWLIRGTGSARQTEEAGIIRFPALYKDNDVHLFVYSTQCNFDPTLPSCTGCYDLRCAQFVPTSHSVAIGGSLAENGMSDSCGGRSPYSVAGSRQCEISVAYTEGSDGSWWLWVNGQPVGLYPASLYGEDTSPDDSVAYGGEVYQLGNGSHTSTQMGSGQFAEAWYGQAAYGRQAAIFDGSTWRPPTVQAYTEPGVAPCYDVISGSTNTDWYWGQAYFFGGPGYNLNCQ